MTTTFIIPCGKAKLDTAAPARDLYVGGMFRLALDTAEKEAALDGGRVLILSALHGLLELDQVVEPYDVKMGDAEAVDAARITEQAVALDLLDDDVYALLPSTYFKTLDDGLRDVYVYASNTYETNRGIGDQRGICCTIRDHVTA